MVGICHRPLSYFSGEIVGEAPSDVAKRIAATPQGLIINLG